MIKYTDTQITFREVPNEVSLSINISNCPYRCKGCHSPYLQKDIGKELTTEVLDKLIEKYKDQITCVTFLGDGGNIEEISGFVKHVWQKGYFTCLYTGSEKIDEIVDICNGFLCYIKIGPYIEEKGALDKPTTNQKFYKVIYETDMNGNKCVGCEDLTDKFLIKY